MKKLLIATAGIAGIAAALTFGGAASAERAVPLPPAAHDVSAAPGLQTAIFAGGCFWGVSAVFEHAKGVKSVVAGYAGGAAKTATYDQVSTETTGHAEAVKIVYDTAQVSYATLLRIYFSVAHDPTQVGGQFPDRGPSYRSAIFPQSPAQKAVAAAYIAQLTQAHAFPKPIATRLEAGAFYPAEAYHQNFFDRNPTHPYIVTYDKPKVAAFKAGLPALYK
jgi:peptide-methionine (S)-S-oxide reductase